MAGAAIASSHPNRSPSAISLDRVAHGREDSRNMSSLYARGRRLWCRLKNESGQWVSKPTPYNTGDERRATRYADAAQRKLDTRRASGSPVAGPLTLRDFARAWILKRRAADLDWRNDESRLRHHALPTLGDIPIAEIRASHVVALIHKLRTDPVKRLAQRTIRNIYSVIAALLRDAELADVIDRAPATLDERQLGPVVDKDPKWRSGSVFTRDEAETLVSDLRIPADRQLCVRVRRARGPATG